MASASEIPPSKEGVSFFIKRKRYRRLVTDGSAFAIQTIHVTASIFLAFTSLVIASMIFGIAVGRLEKSALTAMTGMS